MSLECDYLFKLLIIGPAESGKSGILRRYADNTFTESYISTIGVDFSIKTIRTSNGKAVKLQIWDTAGQERFRTITNSYYRGASGVLLVFDCSSEKSFGQMDAFYSIYSNTANPNTPLYLVANKIDLNDKRTVSATTASEYATAHGMKYAEVSAKTNVGIDSIFASLTEDLVTILTTQPYNPDNVRPFRLTQPVQPPKPFIEESHDFCTRLQALFRDGMQNSSYSKKPVKMKLNLGFGEMEESAYTKFGKLIVSYERDEYLYTQGISTAKTGITIAFLVSDSHYDITPFETFFNHLPIFTEFFPSLGIAAPKISTKFDYSQKEGKKVVLLTIDFSEADKLNEILNIASSILENDFRLPKLLEILNFNFSNSFKPQNSQSTYSYGSSSSSSSDDEDLKITGKINFELQRGILEHLLILLNDEPDKKWVAVVSALAFGFKTFSFDLEFDDLSKLFREILVPHFFAEEKGSSTTKFTFSNLQNLMTPEFGRMFFPNASEDLKSKSKEDLEKDIPADYKTFFDLFVKDNVSPEISELKFFVGNQTVIKLEMSGLSLLSIFPSPSALVAGLTI